MPGLCERRPQCHYLCHDLCSKRASPAMQRSQPLRAIINIQKICCQVFSLNNKRPQRDSNPQPSDPKKQTPCPPHLYGIPLYVNYHMCGLALPTNPLFTPSSTRLHQLCTIWCRKHNNYLFYQCGKAVCNGVQRGKFWDWLNNNMTLVFWGY